MTSNASASSQLLCSSSSATRTTIDLISEEFGNVHDIGFIHNIANDGLGETQAISIKKRMYRQTDR